MGVRHGIEPRAILGVGDAVDGRLTELVRHGGNAVDDGHETVALQVAHLVDGAQERLDNLGLWRGPVHRRIELEGLPLEIGLEGSLGGVTDEGGNGSHEAHSFRGCEKSCSVSRTSAPEVGLARIACQA
jgi:hypothetical protein